MKVFNSKLAAIGLAAFVFASCSDSTSEGEKTPLSPDVTVVGLAQSDAEQLVASVTNYKNAIAKARTSRAADATVFSGLTEMKSIPAQPNTGIGEVTTGKSNLVNGKFFIHADDQHKRTVDLCGKTIQNAEIWVNGQQTLIYDETKGGNKIYVEKGAHLVFKGTGSAIASNDEVIIEQSGDFTSQNDITIDGTLYSTTSIGSVNKNENKEVTGPAQNVTINGDVFLYGYESPTQKDKDGKPIWSFASIRAKKLTIGENARVNVEDKISFTNDAEVNGAVHVGKTMEVENLTIGNTGNVSSDISIKVKNALTMNGGKLAVDYLNVTDNTYSSDGTEKKKTANGTATATLNGNATITVNANGVLNFNILKTDNTEGQIVLNSNDATSYAVIKADQFEYPGGEVKCLSTPQNNSAAFLLQFTKNKANGTDVDFKDLAISASYLDYDVVTDGSGLQENIEAGKYHTWTLKADAVAKIKNLPKLDLVAAMATPADGQSATSILPYGGKLYVSYHTNGNAFGGNIEVAQMNGNQLEKLQSVYQNGEGKADFNHLNVIDGKLYLAGSTKGSSLMAYTELSDGLINTTNGLTTLPFSTGGTSKDQADFGDANCVVKNGSKIYVASTRGYEIFDPTNGYLHTYLATAGKAKFIASSGNNLYGLNYTSAVKANESSVDGQVQVFNAEDLSSTSQTFNVGAIAPNNGKNAIAVDNGKVYVCQSAKGLICYENGTEKWKFVAPTSTSDKNKLVDNVEGYANGVAYDNNYVYLACGSYGLVVLNKADGSVVAHRNIGDNSANYVAVDNSGNIYVAYGQSRIQVFKLTNTVK